jgi:hypothetical protein
MRISAKEPKGSLLHVEGTMSRKSKDLREKGIPARMPLRIEISLGAATYGQLD